MKFEVGDNIVVDEYGRGFEKATVTGVIEQNGKQYYTLKIMNVLAILLYCFYAVLQMFIDMFVGMFSVWKNILDEKKSKFFNIVIITIT